MVTGGKDVPDPDDEQASGDAQGQTRDSGDTRKPGEMEADTRDSGDTRKPGTGV
jgi:hypothetical protein